MQNLDTIPNSKGCNTTDFSWNQQCFASQKQETYNNQRNSENLRNSGYDTVVTDIYRYT